MVLDGKVCIITGAGSGIGKATAHQMAYEGAKIALVGRTFSKVNVVKSELESEGVTCEPFGLDVSDQRAVKKMVAEVIQKFGRVDILLNNAGHSSIHRRLLSTTP